MENVVADLREILRFFQLPKINLLGYSMGGRLALYFATIYPQLIGKLILESASPGLQTESERQERIVRDNQLADRIEHDGIESFVDFWESLPLWNSQQQFPQIVRDNLRKQRLTNNPLGLANSLRGMGTGFQPSLWDKLPFLQIPAQLIVGELDSKFVQIGKQMNHLLPQSTMTIIENAGHTVHLEKPSEYLACILE
jgi:2-succinyl-6-hydroxy-2,4-cyclohexadiene-1-carboxylate synthase